MYTGNMIKYWKPLVCGVFLLVIGIVIGAYLFKDTRPRSFLTLPNCSTSCYSQSELLGLLTSVGIQKLPKTIPVVKETDKVIVINSPSPTERIDYLILLKKDIKDLGDISSAEREYLDDAFLVMSELVREQNLKNYQVTSNGPGYQITNYLHFHLLAE